LRLNCDELLSNFAFQFKEALVNGDACTQARSFSRTSTRPTLNLLLLLFLLLRAALCAGRY